MLAVFQMKLMTCGVFGCLLSEIQRAILLENRESLFLSSSKYPCNRKLMFWVFSYA